MKPREKILALTLVGVVAAYLTYQVALWLVVEPFQALRKDLRDKAERKSQLEKLVRFESDAAKEWEGRTKRVLAAEPRAAQDEFYERISQLLTKHGFGQSDTNLKNQPIKPAKNGFVEVPITVNAKGTLESVAAFLRDYYRQPYFTQVSGTLTLTPEEKYVGGAKPDPAADKNKPKPPVGRPPAGPPRDAAHSGAGKDFLVRLNFTATTLVLPRLPNAPYQTSPPDAPVATERLAYEPAAYDRIAQVNFFKKYEPPPPEPPPVARGSDTRPVEPHRPPAPPRDPRLDYADKMRLVGVYTEDGQPVARVIDDRIAGASEAAPPPANGPGRRKPPGPPPPSRSAGGEDRKKNAPPPAAHHVGDHVDDGTLVLIRLMSSRSPAGMVVRVEKKEGDQIVETTDYFYELGKTFMERELLTPGGHPDVWRELRLARGGGD